MHAQPGPLANPHGVPPEAHARPGAYFPIEDYALIGDTLTTALVSCGGSLDWLCLPDVDSPSLFAAILDSERGGLFFVGAADEAETSREYVGDSAVLRSRHRTPEGVLQVTDFMPLGEGGARSLQPARRVLRLVEAVEGTPQVSVAFAPRPDYGRSSCVLRPLGAGEWRIADGRDFVLFRSEVPLTLTGQGTLAGRERLTMGERREVALSFCRNDPGILPATGPDHAEAELEATLGLWRNVAGKVDYHGPFRAAVVRSLVTLRLLTFSQSGAVLAAATTSLPEAIGGGRNFDYRYCWLRDTSFVINAFAALGQTQMADAFFRWLMHATQLTAPELRTFYSVFGRTDISDHHIQSLEGYRGSAPVHLGNGAQSQLQLDAYGSVMTAAAAFCRHGGKMGASERHRLKGFADVVVRQWSLPDDGLWEMPGPRVHNTYSKVMCWAALDAYCALCRSGHIEDEDPAAYAQERDRIRENVMSRGWNARRGAFTGAYGRDWLDASLLLMPRMGIIEATDPRMVATYELMQAELGRGAQMRRYAHGVDGIASVEGTFTVCGFWAADYLARRGDLDAAEARIGALLAHANDLLLMAEELDPDDGRQLGNYPQGFSHAGLIGAAMTLHDAREAERRPPA